MRLIPVVLLLFLLPTVARAQTGIGTHTPASSAALDITSTSKGFLPPRMSWSQIRAIQDPVPGLTVYDIGIRSLRIYDGAKWIVVAPRTTGSLNDPPGTFSSGGTESASSTFRVSALSVLPDKCAVICGYTAAPASVAGMNITGTGCFIAFLDSNGIGVWVKELIATSNNTFRINTVLTDASGNIFIGGELRTTADFNPDPAAAADLTASGMDGFIARYSRNGVYQWATAVGASGNQSVWTLATDGSQLYAGGYYTGTLNLGSGFTAFGTDGFVARASLATGIFSGWVFRVAGPGTDAVQKIALQNTGTLLVGGFFQDSVAYGSATTTSTAGFNGYQDGFLVPVTTAAGTPGVFRRIGGKGADIVADFTIGATGNIYVCGYFEDTVNFNLLGGNFRKVSELYKSGYIAAYNSSFSLLWVKSYGSGTDDVLLTNIAQKGSSELTATGYGQAIAFPDMSFTTYGASDVFLLTTTVTGVSVWLQHAGGRSSDASVALAVSADGQLIYSAANVSLPFITYEGVRTATGNAYLSRYEE